MLRVMAAWIVVGVMAGLWIGYLAGVWGERKRGVREVREAGPIAASEVPANAESALERVVERLLTAIVPPVPADPAVTAEQTDSPGEYDPPEEPVGDWTDPFLGLERPLVARLAPGQQIAPGLPREDLEDGGMDAVETWREAGAASFDEWARDTMAPDAHETTVGWVEPIDLAGEEMI